MAIHKASERRQCCHAINARFPFSMSAYVRGFLSIYMFSYTQIVSSSMNFLFCVDVGDNQSVVFAYPALSCQTSFYQSCRIAVIFVFMLACIVTPIGFWWFLWRAYAKGRINAANDTFDKSWSVFYDQCRPGSLLVGVVGSSSPLALWWWMCIFSQSNNFRLFGFALLGVASLTVHLWFRPFSDLVHHHMETV